VLPSLERCATKYRVTERVLVIGRPVALMRRDAIGGRRVRGPRRSVPASGPTAAVQVAAWYLRLSGVQVVQPAPSISAAVGRAPTSCCR